MMRPRRVYVGTDLERLLADDLTHLAGTAERLGIAMNADSSLLVDLQRPPFLAALREGTVREKTMALRNKGIGPPDWTAHWFRHSHATALLLAGSGVLGRAGVRSGRVGGSCRQSRQIGSCTSCFASPSRSLAAPASC